MIVDKYLKGVLYHICVDLRNDLVSKVPRNDGAQVKWEK